MGHCSTKQCVYIKVQAQTSYKSNDSDYDIQQQRLREMGEDVLSQDVVVLNLNSGSGWQSPDWRWVHP